MTTRRSSAARLQAAIEAIAFESRRVSDRSTREVNGQSVRRLPDVRIVELSIIHVFVSEPGAVRDGARVLVARTLGTDPNSFDIEIEPHE